MPQAQIYSMVNTIANNINYTGSTVVDTSSFVAFGQAVLSDPALTESVYNKMYDLIGRTLIAIDEAEDEELEKLISEASSAGSSAEDIGSETEGEEAAE